MWGMHIAHTRHNAEGQQFFQHSAVKINEPLHRIGFCSLLFVEDIRNALPRVTHVCGHKLVTQPLLVGFLARLSGLTVISVAPIGAHAE